MSTQTMFENPRASPNVEYIEDIVSFRYSKTSKNLDTQRIAVIILKFEQCGLTIEYHKFPKYTDTQKRCCTDSKTLPIE